MNDPAKPCYCQSGQPYGQCCGPFLAAEARPSTAEALMRSRYSAYCEKQVAYLVETLHPDRRQPDTSNQIRTSMENTRWLGLTIISSNAGSATDTHGQVTFIAAYDNGQGPQALHE